MTDTIRNPKFEAMVRHAQHEWAVWHLDLCMTEPDTDHPLTDFWSTASCPEGTLYDVYIDQDDDDDQWYAYVYATRLVAGQIDTDVSEVLYKTKLGLL